MSIFDDDRLPAPARQPTQKQPRRERSPLNIFDTLFSREHSPEIDPRLFSFRLFEVPPGLPRDATARIIGGRVEIAFKYDHPNLITFETLRESIQIACVAAVGRYRVPARFLKNSSDVLAFTFEGQLPDFAKENDWLAIEREHGIEIPARQDFHIEVGVKDAARLIINEYTDAVRVHLTGTQVRDVG